MKMLEAYINPTSSALEYFIKDNYIEDSVDNLLLVLRFCKDVGHYA